MKIIGKTTIHPILFYSGKAAGYITWIVFLLSALNFIDVGEQPIESLKILSIVLSFIGLLIVFISLINLGDSTSLGLPSENTDFKESGLYRLSRNPMYLGFDLLTVASIVFTTNIFIAVLGIYSIVIYHFIIIGEEKFLRQRFGKSYSEYTERVRRYI